MEAMRASFNGGSGDTGIVTSAGHHMVVRKANIVPEGSSTVQHKSSKFTTKAPLKKAVVVQGRGSQQMDMPVAVSMATAV